MKKLSEVCKIMGVHRRTLQEYDKIGLLHPTEKRKGNGYWYYDDDAIGQLFFIRIFTEAGFTSTRIKELLEAEDIDIAEEMKKAVQVLEEKQKQISRLIAAIKVTWIEPPVHGIPDEVIEEIGLEKFFGETGFTTNWKSLLEIIGNAENTDVDETVIEIQMINILFILGYLQSKEPASDIVQKTILTMYSDYRELLRRKKLRPKEKKTYYEAFYNHITWRLKHQDLADALNVQTGPNATEFISRAVSIFCENYAKNSTSMK